MQKKLIALAIAGLASSGAYAQTTVTLSGLMDLGYTSASLQTAGVKTTTNNFGVRNNTATSNVAFTAIEDLGGGMKAKVYIETDPAFGTATGAALSNANHYLELSGNFGAVSMGFMNNFALTAATTAQPFGTAMGGGYSGDFGRLDGVRVLGPIAVVGLGTTGVRDIRAENSVMYKTPNFSGFSGGLVYKVKNTDAGTAPIDQVGQRQVGLAYNNGPLNVQYAWSQIVANNALVAAFFTGAPDKVTHNLLGANYKFGPATIYGGWTSSKSGGGNDALGKLSTNSWNIAGKYEFTSTIAGMINYLRVNDNSSLAGADTNADRRLTGLGLDYSLSKRSALYARYEKGDNNKGSGTAGDFTRYALGMRHSF